MLERVGKVIFGLLLIALGVLGGLLPFLPGWPLGLFGVALVLSQSTPGRRVLTRLRLWARGRYGAERARQVERVLPRDAVSTDTTQMRLDLDAYERERRSRRRRRR